MHTKIPIYSAKQKGSLLLELLIVIALLAVILGIGTEAVLVSMKSGKVSGERDVAMGLATEEVEAVRAIVEENWQNIYVLVKNTQYHTVQSGTKWTTTVASEIVTLSGTSFTRYFIVQNICRDTVASSRAITGITDTNGTTTTCTSSTGEFDPSTQKVITTISWQNADPVTISTYLYRWQNKICAQTNWSGGTTTPADMVAPCTTTTYYSDDAKIDNTTIPGSIQLK